MEDEALLQYQRLNPHFGVEADIREAKLRRIATERHVTSSVVDDTWELGAKALWFRGTILVVKPALQSAPREVQDFG